VVTNNPKTSQWLTTTEIYFSLADVWGSHSSAWLCSPSLLTSSIQAEGVALIWDVLFPWKRAGTRGHTDPSSSMKASTHT